jgi:hypothetical protein
MDNARRKRWKMMRKMISNKCGISARDNGLVAFAIRANWLCMSAVAGIVPCVLLA